MWLAEWKTGLCHLQDLFLLSEFRVLFNEVPFRVTPEVPEITKLVPPRQDDRDAQFSNCI